MTKPTTMKEIKQAINMAKSMTEKQIIIVLQHRKAKRQVDLINTPNELTLRPML